MNSKKKAVGTSEFYTFAHLLNGADSLLKSAQEHAIGSGHCRTAAVLFSAFAIEAHFNHIGEQRLSFWSIVEPKLSWRQKLNLIVHHFGIKVDDGKRPFQTLNELFKFRALPFLGVVAAEFSLNAAR
jgi:hypothetical protein